MAEETQTVEVAGSWDEAAQCSGPGMIVDGALKAKRRFVVKDAEGQRHRYWRLDFDVQDALERQYKDGKEVEALSHVTTRVRTGHLNSSYVSKTERSDRVALDEMKRRVKPSQTAMKIEGTRFSEGLAFLVPEGLIDGVDLDMDAKYRFRTHGDSCFVESLGVVDRLTKAVTNYSGSTNSGAIGDAWTSKIMAQKAQADYVPGQDLEGVDEDEWDDDDSD